MPKPPDADEARSTVEDLPELLRRMRARLELTQVQMAERAGIDQAQLARYEIGKMTPSLRLLAQLAVAYGFDRLEIVFRPRPKRRK